MENENSLLTGSSEELWGKKTLYSREDIGYDIEVIEG